MKFSKIFIKNLSQAFLKTKCYIQHSLRIKICVNLLITVLGWGGGNHSMRVSMVHLGLFFDLMKPFLKPGKHKFKILRTYRFR